MMNYLVVKLFSSWCSWMFSVWDCSLKCYCNFTTSAVSGTGLIVFLSRLLYVLCAAELNSVLHRSVIRSNRARSSCLIFEAPVSIVIVFWTGMMFQTWTQFFSSTWFDHKTCLWCELSAVTLFTWTNMQLGCTCSSKCTCSWSSSAAKLT